MLAITRQSAWERWRDLDDDVETPAAEPAKVGTAVPEVGGRARRHRMVAVPDLVGLTSADAVGILTRTGLQAVSATPDHELLEDYDDLRPTVVVRQYPDPGTRIQTTSTVRLWLERGDGEADVREPRRPTTPPRAFQIERDQRAEEAVG